MSSIGNLTASANNTFNLSYLPERLLIGAVDTNNPLSFLSVTTKGENNILLTSAARIIAVGKLDNSGILGADVKVGNFIRLALGRVDKETTINTTNGAAGTESVQVQSTEKSNVARKVTETTVVANANNTYKNFDALLYDPTNCSQVILTYANGYQESLTANEVDALFASENITDADGRLNGFSVIKKFGQKGAISTAQIFANNSGNLLVVQCGYRPL